MIFKINKNNLPWFVSMFVVVFLINFWISQKIQTQTVSAQTTSTNNVSCRGWTDNWAINTLYASVVGRNVGIGTGSAMLTHKLEVVGSINGTSLCIAGICRSSWPVATATGLSGTGTSFTLARWNNGNLDSSLITDNGTLVSVDGGVSVTGNVSSTDTITATNGFCIGASCITSWPTSSGSVGSGTVNYISKWTSGTTIGNSLIFDNGTNVGIGTATPAQKLDVAGTIKSTGLQFTGGAPAAGKFLGSDAAGNASWQSLPPPPSPWGFGGIYMDGYDAHANPITGGHNCPNGFTNTGWGFVNCDSNGCDHYLHFCWIKY